jgi:hypothetical protein
VTSCARLALPLALSWVACAPATEVVVVVDSDLRVPEHIDRVLFRVVGSTVLQSTEIPLSTDAQFPLTHGVYPSGRNDFTVVATGQRGTANVVEDRATTGFVDGERRMLTLWLGWDCIGVVCPTATDVCSRNGCRPQTIAPETLPEWTGVIERVDPVDPRDGGSYDGGFYDGGFYDGGLPDGGSPDGGPPESCVGRIACEDFEDDTFALTGPHGSGGSVSTMRPHRGMRSFAVGASASWFEFAGLGIAPGSTLYVRYHVFLTGDDAFSTDYVVATDAGGTGRVVFGSFSVISPVTTRFFTGPWAMETMSAESSPLPMDRWVCVELEIRVGVSDGRVRALFEGVESLAAETMRTSDGNALDEIAIGLQETDVASTGLRGYFDDIVLDDAPIGCLE